MELSLDTSTGIASVALSQEGIPLAEASWRTGWNHTVELLPTVEWLLQRVKASPRDLAAVFVARGPGSFNGLRVGVATAKGLAFAHGVPLIGVGTLELEAAPFAAINMPLCPVLDAGRGEVVAGLYRAQGGAVHPLGEPRLMTLEDLCAGTMGPTFFCGEHVSNVGAALREKLGSLAVFPWFQPQMRRAGYLASIGWQRLQQGTVDDVLSLQPLYVRGPSITQPKSKQAT